MPSFKQKSIIRSYKLRLQEKLKTVTEETEKSISFLNNRLLELKNRVEHILEIKDEKCLSLYRKLSSDLESHSEKLFILQASFEEVSEDETDSSENEETESTPDTNRSNCASSESRLSTDQSNSVHCSSSCVASKKLNSSSGNIKSELENTKENASCLLRNANSELKNFCATSLNLGKDAKSVTETCSQNASYAGDEKSELDASYVEKNTKTKLADYYEGAESTTEDDFWSLPSNSTMQNIANTTFLLNSESNRCHSKSNLDRHESNQSFSQSSCYRSLSSNISEPLVLSSKSVKSIQSSEAFLAAVENEISVESESAVVIPPPDIKVPSTISATLAHIVDPGDFWMQVEGSSDTNIRFSKAEYTHLSGLSSIREGSYCLAPFKSSPFFYRGVSLSNAESGNEKVNIHLIDHGSTQEVSLCDLRILPASANGIPAQAFHCYLYGAAPIDNFWSAECIETFKNFRDYYSIETAIKSKDSLYAVQLSANSSEDFHEDFSVDVALYLCLQGFAISENESMSLSMDSNNCFETQPLKSASSIINSTEVSDMTAISNDSGVSVTSVYKSNQSSAGEKHNFDDIKQDYRQNFHQISAIPIIDSSKDSCDKKFGLNYNSQAEDLISFESNDILDLKNSSENAKFTDVSSKSICFICKKDNFCLHLPIPPPDLVFVEKDMMIVMLSHIVTPHEFYVNLAMEDIVNLDELREQMTSTYESQKKDFPPITMDDLRENMFCAGYYEVDGYWYRVKVLALSSKNMKNGLVTVQYIDYGNTATIKCSNLQPLTSQFSEHPAFAIKCSLAGIVPVVNTPPSAKCGFQPIWNEDANNTFKRITSFERCLTAQICSDLHSENNDSLPVLLWDTEESDDRLLNLILADLGVAEFDKRLSPVLPLKESTTNPTVDISKPSKDVDILNTWDPMAEEYHDIENSYAVNVDDLQVLTSGYQAKDEEYTCKYYSLRGYCPRGSNCPYEHLPMLECGLTRDREAVYCLDNLITIPETTVNTIVNVSAIKNPSHFYVVFPYGCRRVDEINSLVSNGSTTDDIQNTEVKALFYAMNKHYSNAPFEENTAVALACGTIVAARHNWDKQWRRGRVVDVSDINGPAKIFFVDSGDSEWVARKFIRTILPKFLYTPFQAVQCSLQGITPIKSEGAQWHSEAVKLFKKVVEGEPLLAEKIQRFGQVFNLSLRRTNQNNHQYIGQLLVSAGFAEFCSDVPSQKKKKDSSSKICYVPG